MCLMALAGPLPRVLLSHPPGSPHSSCGSFQKPWAFLGGWYKLSRWGSRSVMLGAAAETTMLKPVFCFSAFPVHVEDAAQHRKRLLPSWRTDGLVACKYLQRGFRP